MSSNKFSHKARTIIGAMAVFTFVVALMMKLKNKEIPAYGTGEDDATVDLSNGKTISFRTKVGDYTSAKATITTKHIPVVTPLIRTNDRTVYYTPGGKSYHHSNSCQTLGKSKIILQGKLSNVVKLGKTHPCNICGK